MKKIFTLFAAIMVAMGMNAQSEWRPAEEAPAAGTAIVDDDLLKVETVFTTTNKKAEVGPEDAKVPVSFTIGEKSYTFNYYTQIRVANAPAVGTETGTDNGGSTSLVIEAKKDVDITMYYRRQSASNTFTDNDGKDLKLVDWDKPTAAIQASTFEYVLVDPDKTDYGYALKLYKLEAGKKYVLWARGTTINFYGFDYQAGGGADIVPPAADGTHVISFDGMSAANELEYSGTTNGFKLKITGNESKTISGAKTIEVNGKNYTSMKVSNGAENTLTLPEGKVATGITFYSYVNGDADDAKPCYWKEVAGMSFDPEVEGTLFEQYGYTDATSVDKRTFDFNGSKLNSITFTNTGIQCCYVIEITIETGEVIDGINNTLGNKQINAVTYNLAGQQITTGFKGIAIQNGKKVVLK